MCGHVHCVHVVCGCVYMYIRMCVWVRVCVGACVCGWVGVYLYVIMHVLMDMIAEGDPQTIEQSKG